MSEQSTLLKNSKDAISDMVSKENKYVNDLKLKINELSNQQEKFKQRTDEFKSKWEMSKQEVETLRQMADARENELNVLREDGHQKNKLLGDVEHYRGTIHKREAEMK